jgi:hypothetical protein
MIVYREWMVKKEGITWDKNPYKFCGWYLFGIIPLYVKRIGY